MHAMGLAIWTPIAQEGATELMMRGNGMGTNWRDLYTTTVLDAHAQWKHRADELSETLKLSMLIGHYFIKHHRGHFYAKAQNLSRKLRAAIVDADSAFEGNSAAASERAPRTLYSTRIRNARQHGAVRCDRTSSHEHPLLYERRAS
jgi:hypothetical protein